MDRRSVLMSGLAAAVVGSTLVMAGCNRQQAAAPKQKTTVNLGMVLEPPGLDPTAGAASAIGEITLYNVYETLTKIGQDGSVQPLLAQSWQASADQKVWTFKLRTDAKFHNGEPFNAETVKFAFERAAAEGSTKAMVKLCQLYLSSVNQLLKLLAIFLPGRINRIDEKSHS